MSQSLELSDVIHDPSTPDAQAHPSKHLDNPDHPRSSSTWAPITDESPESRPPLAPSGTSDNNTNNSNTSSSKPSPPRPSLRSARANSSIILRSPVLGPRSASAHPPIINNDLDEIRQSRVGPTRTNGRTHRRVASDQSSSYPHYDSSVRRPYSDTASRPQTPSQGGGPPHSHSHHHSQHHPVRSHSFHHHDRHTIVPFRHPSTPLVSGGGGIGGSIGIGGSTSAAAPAGAVASPTYSTYSNYSLFNTQPSSRSPSGSDPRSASPATSVSSDRSSSVMHTAPNSAVLLPDRIDSPSGRRPPHRYEVPGGGVSTLQFPTTASASSYGRPGSPYDNGAVLGSVNGSGAGRQKNRKQRLTNAHRKQICIFHNENPTMRQEDIAAHFNVERSTISKILKSAEKWLSVPEGDDDKVAKHRPSKFPVIEQRLVKWLESMYEQGAMPTLGDALIRTRARDEAKAMSCSEDKFKASSGWVENFKHRHCIRKGVWHRDEYYATAAATMSSTGLSSLSSASHQLPPPLSKLNPAYEPSVRPPYVGSPLAMSAASTTMMSHVPPSPSPMSSVAGPSRHHFVTAPVMQSPDEEESVGMNVDHEMVDGTTGPYSRYSAAAMGSAEAGPAALPRLSSVPHSPSRILAPLSLMQQHHHHHQQQQQQQPYGSYDPHEHHHHHHHHQGHSTSYDYQQHKLPPLNAAIAEQGDPSPSSSSSSSSAAAAASATRPLKLLDRPDGGETPTTVLPPMYDHPDDQGAHVYRPHHHPTDAGPSSSSTASSSLGVSRYQQQEHSPNEEHHPNSAYPHEQEQQQEQEPFSTTEEEFSARARREFPPPPINDARPHIPEVEYAINTLLEFLDREGKGVHGLDQKDVAALHRIKKVLFEYAGGV